MYRLRDLKNGFYQIHKKGMSSSWEGTPRSIFQKAQDLGLKPLEIAHAVKELTAKNDDYADFGMNGTFIFTKRDQYSKK